MTRFLKKLLYRTVSLENYLRILQRSYFLLYRTGYLKKNSIYDYHYFVKKLIRKGDVVIDIGANLGYYSILFSEWVGSEGQVHSVEPVKVYNKIFNELARKRKNIKLYPYAMGAENKMITIVDPAATAKNGGSNPYLNTGLMHVYDKEKDGELAHHKYQFEAEMKRPSLLFGPLERIDYVKCDVEGFEVVVLTDMEDLIRKHKPMVQAEINHVNRDQMLQLFGRLHYSPYRLVGGELVKQVEGLENSEYEFIFKSDL